MSDTLPGTEPAGSTPVRVRPRPVRVRTRKWSGRAHWEHDTILLGTDEHGAWLGAPAGTVVSRPGARFVTDQATLTLVPHTGAFLATFYAHGGTVPCEVYVDITSEPCWAAGPDGGPGHETVGAVDLDLDVVRGWSGRVWVEDDDEFAAHRVRDAYPAEVVHRAARTCEEVRLALTDRRPPYDGTARTWFEALATATRGPA
jgi:uncharacterized protein